MPVCGAGQQILFALLATTLCGLAIGQRIQAMMPYSHSPIQKSEFASQLTRTLANLRYVDEFSTTESCESRGSQFVTMLRFVKLWFPRTATSCYRAHW